MFQSGTLTFQSRTLTFQSGTLTFLFQKIKKILHKLDPLMRLQFLGTGFNIKFCYLSGTFMFQIGMIVFQIKT